MAQDHQAHLLPPPTPQPTITPTSANTLQPQSTSDAPSVDPYQMFVQAGSQLLSTMADMRGHYEGMQKKIDGRQIEIEEQRKRLKTMEASMTEDDEDYDEYDDEEFEQLQLSNENLLK